MEPEARRGWRTTMVPRPPDEPHRSATPLELLFDLCFVVAVAQASSFLHHGLAEGAVGHSVLSYLQVFFGIWWAWMNFTWFASAYDCDDVPYRLTTLVQIAGALILAAGIPSAFDDANLAIVTLGYVLMRLAMVTQWLRAARSDPARRRTDLRYALGITITQIGWIARLWLPQEYFAAGFGVLVAAELLVPVFAERAEVTPWHPRHIAERYGLFTLIVLGESILSATLAIEAGVDTGIPADRLVPLVAGGLVIVFAMWWLYFDRSDWELLTSLRRAIFWGYGHYVVFASAAAVGAGLAVAADHATHTGHLSDRAAGYAVAVPVAVYLTSVFVLHAWPHRRGAVVVAYPAAVLLVLRAPLVGAAVPVVAAILAALVAVVVLN